MNKSAIKHSLLAGLLFIIAAAVACLALPGVSRADAIPNLGASSNFAILELAGGNTVNNSLVTITGNEGAIQGSKITNQAPSIVTGNVYVDQASQYSGPGTVNGSVITDTTLMGSSGTVQTDVNNVITTIQGDTFPTSGSDYFGSGISTATTINASGTLTDVAVNGDINLNNMNLTLNGTSSQFFLIDVTGNLSLGGSASLLLTGGITPSNVIYYFSGPNCTFNTHVGDTSQGILLAPSSSCNLTSMDGTFDSEIISAGNIQLLSGANVFQPTTPSVPEASSITLAFIVLLAFVGVVSWRRLPALR